MNLEGNQEERLRFAVRNLRRTPEWSHIHQLFVAEGSEDKPDFHGLRNHVVQLLAGQVDMEVESAMSKRAAAVGRP